MCWSICPCVLCVCICLCLIFVSASKDHLICVKPIENLMPSCIKRIARCIKCIARGQDLTKVGLSSGGNTEKKWAYQVLAKQKKNIPMACKFKLGV